MKIILLRGKWQNRLSYDRRVYALFARSWVGSLECVPCNDFSSYHLWLDWKKPAHYLISQFVDYEPGIHYSQVQMQSGTTGINATEFTTLSNKVLIKTPKVILFEVILSLGLPGQYSYALALSEKLQNYPMPIVDEKIVEILRALIFT